MDAIRIKEGMDVLGVSGDKIGEVGKVIVGQQSREARFFTIREGLIFRHEMLVPREAIRRVDVTGAAHVALTQDQLEAMPPYNGDPPTEEEARKAYQILGARVGGDYLVPQGRNHELGEPAYRVPAVERYGHLPEDEHERRGYRTEWTYGPVPQDDFQGPQ